MANSGRKPSASISTGTMPGGIEPRNTNPAASVSCGSRPRPSPIRTVAFADQNALRQVDPRRAEEQACGGEDAAVWRDDDPRHVERPGQSRCVEATGSSERDEPRIPRIGALFDRDGPDRSGHDFLYDTNDAKGRLFGDQSGPCAEDAECLGGPDALDRETPAERGIAGDPTEHDVRIGDGRLIPSPRVAGRSWFGAGAPRADSERPSRIDPGNTPTAGTHGVDRRRWHPAREACDLPFIGDLRPTVLDSADIG